MRTENFTQQKKIVTCSQLLSHCPRRRVFTAICLFYRTISQKPMQLGLPNWTQKSSTMSLTATGSKGQRSRSRDESQQVCVGLQTDRNIAAGCVRKPRWVFPAAMPRRTSHGSNAGFSPRHFPSPLLLPRDIKIIINHARRTDRRFFRAWSFSPSRDKQTLDRRTLDRCILAICELHPAVKHCRCRANIYPHTI